SVSQRAHLAQPRSAAAALCELTDDVQVGWRDGRRVQCRIEDAQAAGPIKFWDQVGHRSHRNRDRKSVHRGDLSRTRSTESQSHTRVTWMRLIEWEKHPRHAG